MQKGSITKYQPFPVLHFNERQWPTRTLQRAPIWCSVDLRDGNQALALPMSVSDKLAMFKLLVDIGFKQIEVGFPAASQIEYDFMRSLIEQHLIPEDVTIQVLVQARAALIEKTLDSLQGVRKAIIHLYNSTSPLQRRVVFGLDKQGIIDIACSGVQALKERLSRLSDTAVTLEYSPESFSSTEIDFALEICEAVMAVWQPTVEHKIILNLPATVEVAMPNVYADQIEWFQQHLAGRERAVISLHTHNDRGTAVASTELGLLAGGERVEGTLFGNGERTGNVDIITVALNMYTQGIDPGLDFSDMQRIRELYERCTRLKVPVRQPYAGELVFTAFSGSHQDAINKGMAAQAAAKSPLWQVPYLPMDPQDIGQTYEAIIRINSQSGKGGVAYILETEFGLQLPKGLQIEFGKLVNKLADARGGVEINNRELYEIFAHEYLNRVDIFALADFYLDAGEPQVAASTPKLVAAVAKIVDKRAAPPRSLELRGRGNGPVDAFVRALNEAGLVSCSVHAYAEHSLSKGAAAQAVAYFELKNTEDQSFFGAATDTNIELASIKAVLSAVNRLLSGRG